MVRLPFTVAVPKVEARRVPDAVMAVPPTGFSPAGIATSNDVSREDIIAHAVEGRAVARGSAAGQRQIAGKGETVQIAVAAANHKRTATDGTRHVPGDDDRRGVGSECPLIRDDHRTRINLRRSRVIVCGIGQNQGAIVEFQQAAHTRELGLNGRSVSDRHRDLTRRKFQRPASQCVWSKEGE